jgi:hypothetical protein
MFNIKLWSGKGNKVAAGVTDDQELCVISAPYPPLTVQRVKPFRQYLTDDGLADGTNDMGVDGSVTNVDYYIPANASEDRYITSLNFIVGYGASGQPNEWADGTALTNGSRLFYTSQRGESEIHEGIKSNQDMFRLSFSPVPTGWEVRHVNATNDFGYFLSMDLTKMGLPFGVKLDRGSSQRLVIRIQDNAGTDADSFNCIAYGFDRFE